MGDICDLQKFEAKNIEIYDLIYKFNFCLKRCRLSDLRLLVHLFKSVSNLRMNLI